VRLEPAQLVPGNLPEVLAETVLLVPPPTNASAWALLCTGRTCLPPITDPEALLQALKKQA